MVVSLYKLAVVFCLLPALASVAAAQGSGMMGSGYQDHQGSGMMGSWTWTPTVTGNQGSQSSGMMGWGTSIPTLAGYQGHELAANMIVPQFVVGDHYTTSMVLFNMGNMAQMPWLTPQTLQLTGKIYFYHQDGTPLQVSINGASVDSQYSFTLAASTSVSVDMTAPGSDTSGWALIDVDDNDSSTWGMMNGYPMMRANRIMATVYYTYKEGGQLVSRAGVIPSVYDMQRYLTSLTPVQVQSRINTGLAIVNTSAQAATVQLTLKNANGQTVGARQLILPAGNQIARFIDEAQLFGGAFTGPFRGFVEIDTLSEGVVAMGLLTTGGIMTPIPTQHYGPVSMMSW